MLSRLAIVFAITALAGCDTGHNPSNPGGGGGGGGGGADAAVSHDDGGADAGAGTLNGVICLVLDPRTPLACPSQDGSGATLDLSGLTVAEVDGATTTTGADGSFSLATNNSDSALLVVSGSDVRDTAIRVNVGAGSYTLPVFDATTWDTLDSTLAIAEPATYGSAAVYITDSGVPATGAEVVQPAGANYAPFYDGSAGPYDWSLNGLTGSYGAAMLFSIPPPFDGHTTFTVIGSGGAPLLTGLAVDVLAATTTVVFVSL